MVTSDRLHGFFLPSVIFFILFHSFFLFPSTHPSFLFLPSYSFLSFLDNPLSSIHPSFPSSHLFILYSFDNLSFLSFFFFAFLPSSFLPFILFRPSFHFSSFLSSIILSFLPFSFTLFFLPSFLHTFLPFILFHPSSLSSIHPFSSFPRPLLLLPSSLPFAAL